eukprot:SAG31_NODE_201_length_20535_cov_15.315081_2_plen_67_part_00
MDKTVPKVPPRGASLLTRLSARWRLGNVCVRYFLVRLDDVVHVLDVILLMPPLIAIQKMHDGNFKT